MRPQRAMDKKGWNYVKEVEQVTLRLKSRGFTLDALKEMKQQGIHIITSNEI